jgi:NAD(P)-dependent dehydrogenase (short-subunit alcohol dehydrogenase family)
MTDAARIALVTGANKGIGLQIARKLTEAGVTVIIGARDRERGEAASAELASLGASIASVQLDLGDEASIAAAADYIANRHGRLDILVNNAGIVDAADEAGDGTMCCPTSSATRTIGAASGRSTAPAANGGWSSRACAAA